MKVKSLRDSVMDRDKYFTLMEMLTKVHLREANATAPVCANLRQLEQSTKENGEKINLWATACFSLYQTS
jgi:hypothetical protein